MRGGEGGGESIEVTHPVKGVKEHIGNRRSHREFAINRYSVALLFMLCMKCRLHIHCTS